MGKESFYAYRNKTMAISSTITLSSLIPARLVIENHHDLQPLFHNPTLPRKASKIRTSFRVQAAKLPAGVCCFSLLFYFFIFIYEQYFYGLSYFLYHIQHLHYIGVINKWVSVFQVEVPKVEPKFNPPFLGFTKTAETWNSRACMIGLIGTFIVELVGFNFYLFFSFWFLLYFFVENRGT